jgi:hypothetical protein
MLRKLQEHEADAVTALLDNISDASRLKLESKGKLFETALADNDIYTLFDLVRKTHFTINGASTANRARLLFSLVQGSKTHDKFVTQFHTLAEYFIADFNSNAHPGFVSIQELLGLLYLTGVDQVFFATKVDETYGKHPDAKIPDCLDLISLF